MKKSLKLFIPFLLVLLISTNAGSQVNLEVTQLDTATLVSGLDTPWEIAWGPDNQIWITERRGVISRLDPETGTLISVLDMSDIVYEVSEAGLLGMAFDPEFSETPWIYFVYNYNDNSSVKERLVRYWYNGNALVNPDTLLNGLSGAGNHNGSRLAFGPDGKLYMTTGDVQNTSTAQDLSTLSGKVLRINKDGAVPADNPDPDSYIWTIGHRNPQGLVFSPSGILYSSEHGPSNDDELNVIEKGRNYGWPDVQGFCNTANETTYCNENNIREPLIAWTPTLAVAGIDYYNHTAIPEWQHSIIMGTLKADRFVVMLLSEDGLSVVEEKQYFTDWWGRLRDLCVSPDGRIFLAVSNKDGRGQVRPGDDRIVELKARASAEEYCAFPADFSFCEGDSVFVQGAWQKLPGTYYDTIPGNACDTVRITSLSYFDGPQLSLPDTIEIARDESYTFTGLEGFSSYEWNGDPDLNMAGLTIDAGELAAGEYTYTLLVSDENGCLTLDSSHVLVSAISSLEMKRSMSLKVFPNPLSGQALYLEGNWAGSMIDIQIINELGQRMHEGSYPAKKRIEVHHNLKPGIYFIQTRDKKRVEGIRLLVIKSE